MSCDVQRGHAWYSDGSRCVCGAFTRELWNTTPPEHRARVAREYLAQQAIEQEHRARVRSQEQAETWAAQRVASMRRIAAWEAAQAKRDERRRQSRIRGQLSPSAKRPEPVLAQRCEEPVTADPYHYSSTLDGASAPWMLWIEGWHPSELEELGAE